MKDLNKNFWFSIREKYPDELEKFLDWIFNKLTTGNSNTYRIDRDGIWGTPNFVMLGLFIGFTLEQPQKRNWFHITGHGSVTEQITRWFEMEYRKSDPSISDEVAKVTEEFKKTFLPTQL